MVLFVKQKTAYEMRISDWSSDVCSSDLSKDTAPIAGEAGLGDRRNMIFSGTAATYGRGQAVVVATGMGTAMGRIAGMRSEERRVGKACVSTCRSRGSP